MYLDSNTGAPYCHNFCPPGCECKARGRVHDHAEETFARSMKHAAIESVERILKYDAPERTYEYRKEIIERATNLADTTTLDSDVIADALYRLLFPGTGG